jgi:hypothetical protein
MPGELLKEPDRGKKLYTKTKTIAKFEGGYND